MFDKDPIEISSLNEYLEKISELVEAAGAQKTIYRGQLYVTVNFPGPKGALQPEIDPSSRAIAFPV